MTAHELDGLLALQEHDAALDRLLHRHQTLPERDALGRAESDLTGLDALIATARAERDDLAREEERLDDEARSLAAKATEVESKMYSGEIGSPRELQAMQSDVEQLRRHQRGLENRELELMEAREPLDATLAELDQQRGMLDGELERIRRALADAESAIIAEMQQERAARDEIAAGIDAVLVKEYERCRAQAQGIGVARLVGTTCQGCHLSIPAIEAESIKKSAGDVLAYCDNCGAILVP
jgi:predicted  nucleic acid-binding Zn-ribbon protein